MVDDPNSDTLGVRKSDIAEVLHGGDDAGWFEKLDANNVGEVTISEWMEFFVRLLQTQGQFGFVTVTVTVTVILTLITLTLTVTVTVTVIVTVTATAN